MLKTQCKAHQIKEFIMKKMKKKKKKLGRKIKGFLGGS